MISRLFGSILILAVLYTLVVFINPNLADQYGDKDINSKIREFKNKSLEFASGTSTSGSVMENIIGNATLYIDETKKNIDGLQITVNTKVTQVKDVGAAISNAYSGVIDATHKIQNLSGTGK